ncbi:MAG: peptidoglycan-binding protein, partial [Gammaproteobacteria bacterium]
AKPQIIESSESTNRSPEKLAAQNKEITQPETAIVTTVVDNTVTPLTEKVEQIAKRPESQVTPTLSKLLDSATEEVTMNAWTGLFRRWGFDSNAKSEALSCSQASRVGLQCLKGSGSWKSITRYNRPVILVMTASNARPVPVLLERVDKNVATVMIDEERMTVSAAEIQQHWLGKFRLLWQLPPGGHSVLRPGERNADVQWLREQLQKEVGESELTASSSFYSFRVKKLLRQFQINRGLSADGIAGPETLIFINSIDAENTKIPLLMADSSNLNKGEN